MKWIKEPNYGPEYFRLHNKGFDILSAIVEKKYDEDGEDYGSTLDGDSPKARKKPWRIEVSLSDYSGDNHVLHEEDYEKRSSAFKAAEGYVKNLYKDFGKMLKQKSSVDYANIPERSYLRELKEERKKAEARQIAEVKAAALLKESMDKKIKESKKNLPSVIKANKKKAELLKKYATREVSLQNSLG
jgi:hypothetical protein